MAYDVTAFAEEPSLESVRAAITDACNKAYAKLPAAQAA